MTNRLRVLQFVVQPVFVVDDGENLTPINVQPITIPAVDWPRVLELVAEGVAQLREQVESPPADEA